MRTITAFAFFLVICSCWCAEVETDNKATESKTSSVVTTKEKEKGKTEKRAPLVMTSVPGEMKYTPDIKYSPIETLIKYSTAQDIKYNQEKHIPTYYQPAPKPQYLFYNPAPPAVPQHQQMVLMFAVPHPSGQFLMLLPAQNFMYPMFYRPQIPQIQQVPQIQQASAPQYQTYSAPGPALAQAAGFAAQQQLAFSGPYRPEKYSSSKQ